MGEYHIKGQRPTTSDVVNLPENSIHMRRFIQVQFVGEESNFSTEPVPFFSYFFNFIFKIFYSPCLFFDKFVPLLYIFLKICNEV